MLQDSITVHASPYLIRGLAKWPVMRIGSLGAFVRKEQPARWDPESQVIYPPTIVLDFVKGFETQLSFEDYLMDSEGFSEEQALAMAHKLQTKIVSGLSESSYFVIPGLGKLSQTANREFSFYTEETALQLLDEHAFGLRKVGAKREKPALTPVAEKELVMKALPKEKTSPRDRLFGWKFFLVVALLGSLGVLLVQYGPWNVQLFSTDPGPSMVSSQPESVTGIENQQPATTEQESDYTNDTSEGVSPDSVLEEIFPASSEFAASDNESGRSSDTIDPQEKSTESSGVTQRRGAPIASAEPLTRGMSSGQASSANQPVGDMGVFRGGDSASRRILAPIRHYHLIAGSFVDASRAQQFVNRLKDEGYDAIILFPEEGSGEPHRVSIYRDSDRQKVAAYADKLKQMGRQGGWVYAERSATTE